MCDTTAIITFVFKTVVFLHKFTTISCNKKCDGTHVVEYTILSHFFLIHIHVNSSVLSLQHPVLLLLHSRLRMYIFHNFLPPLTSSYSLDSGHPSGITITVLFFFKFIVLIGFYRATQSARY